MTNLERREKNKEFWQQKDKVPLWRIADKIGIHEKTLIVWLRDEVEPKKLSLILKALKQAKADINREKTKWL